MPQIVVEALAKTYRVAERAPGLTGALRGLVRRQSRAVHALVDVSFSLEAGELLAFIGPNGAGKSTTVKILSGILRPTSGRVEVGGLIPYEDRIRHVARIGVVFGQRSQLWWDLPIVDGFDLLADIYRVDPARYRERRDELVAMLRLEPLLAQPVRQLSLGQRMRAEFAAALLHDPEILFLDEPTIGLDAPSKLAVRDFVRRLNRERGVTVLLTTHDMQDVEALAERVIVIGQGRLLTDGPFASLRAGVLAERRLHIDFAGPAPEIAIPGVTVRSRAERSLELAFDPAKIPTPKLIAAIAAEHAVEDVHVEEVAIEEVITRFYELHDLTDIRGHEA
jgi:ABC-2 type transport system ATP-binding protein